MKRGLLSSMVACMFVLTSANAQEKCFARPSDFFIAPRTQGFASADFDHDGNPDLAVISYSDSEHQKLNILLGNADGTFRSRTQYSMFYLGGDVAVGDLNGDGNADVVATSWGIDVFLGNGDGTFQKHTHFNGPPLGYLSLGDFNKDGLADVLVSASFPAPNSLAVLLGRGDGSFVAKNLPWFYGVKGQVVADFNGDSVLDLALISWLNHGTMEIEQGNGDGTFTPIGTYSTDVSDPFAIVAADFDKDGTIDLAVANTGTNDIAVFHGTGDGSFQVSGKYFARIPQDLVAADFNGDGSLDLLSVYPGYIIPATMSFLPGNGDGTFQSTIKYLNVPTGVDILMAIDFDSDGLPDIATINSDNGHVAVGLNTGDCP
ncbi:MAG TPA: VCBS repeat-containing protein [Terriglobales bacterium]